jgi:hypothetical protein
MAMKDEDFQVLMKHLRKKFSNQDFILKCPTCHVAAGWNADGPFAVMGYREVSDGPAWVGGDAYPVVILSCKNCHYVMKFGWLRIRAEVSGG